MKSLKFYQVYFEDEQLKQCYDFATPYKNEMLTDFFENSVILRLVPECTSDFISICSWRLRKKRMDGWTPVVLKFGANGDDLSEEKILSQDFDVANLTPRSMTHKMLTLAPMWHKGYWEEPFEELKKFLPFKVPDEVKTPIYENHFIARKEIYHEYVNTVLSPVMEFMRGNDIFFMDSGYAQKKERGEPGAAERYKKLTGRNDWPIAPFILERLFSIWIDNKNFKIVNV